MAAQGAFLFVIEGPGDWLDFAEQMLVSALVMRGAGAKTRAGYGLFAATDSPDSHEGSGPSGSFNPGREWVDARIRELSANPGVQSDQALRGKALAEAWSSTDDLSLKQSALADIRTRWEEKGWWDNPQGGAARKARAIYDAYLQQQDETA